MEIIGESMHLLNPPFLGALNSRNGGVIVKMARLQADAGVTALDINIGQSRKLAASTQWLIETIQEQVKLPLFLSGHVLQMVDALQTHKGTPVINAVTVNRADLPSAMEVAKSNKMGLVVLLVSQELTPNDVNGRLQLAQQVMDTAQEVGLPLAQLYLDPVIACRHDPASWGLAGGLPDVDIIYDSLALLKEMSAEWKTIIALSNASVCLPSGKRSALHRRLLPLFYSAGLDAVILNALDTKLMAVVREIISGKTVGRVFVGDSSEEKLSNNEPDTTLKVKGIAESINIMGIRSGTAMKARSPEAVQEMAREETAAGASYLDLNIGPARKDGTELMPWVVQTVESIVDTPLCLDTTNTDAMIAGFKVVKNKEAAIMNSISAQPERMEALIPVAAEAGCNVIALLWGPDGMPRDSAERATMAVDLLMALNDAGIPNEKILFDPIGTPMTLGADQIASGLEFMEMLKDIAPGSGSTVGLSNVSNGVAEHLRKYLDRTYLIMLMKYGISTAIVNSYDPELMGICKGERQELVEMVHGMMDGVEPAPDTLDATALEHYKTYKALSGQIVFSESWLEL